MTTEINFGKTLTLQQAAALILATPKNRYLLEGEPGIGKSSIMNILSKARPDYWTSYMDVPTMDLGDIAMPMVDKEKRITEYAPNSRFMLQKGEPVIIMLDEFSKGADPIKNMLHPMLETNKPRLGDIDIDPRSIVYLTGNLSSDGVGDSLKAHTKAGRVIIIRVRKPNHEEWLPWAVSNNINGVVCAWVDKYPRCLASYLDGGQSDNPYIFNPKKVMTACVTPRSLERASYILDAREALDDDTLIAALSGCLGESAARDIQAYVAYQDQLPHWSDIISDPKGAKVPHDAGACSVMVYSSIQKIDKSNMDNFMKYLQRFDSEWQAAFAVNIAKDKTKQAVAFSSKAFANWVEKNEDLL